MTTATRSRDLTDIPVIDEDDVCHLLAGDSNCRTCCGAPFDCTGDPANAKEWNGQEVCVGCGRLVCPECTKGSVPPPS